MRQKLRIIDPALNEYVYSVLYNASTDDKARLPPKYYKLLKSERAARSFSEKSTMDEKIDVLSYLGINHCVVLVDNSMTAPKHVKGILAKYKSEKNVVSLQDIVDSKLYVTSNKQFISMLMILSQTISNQSYKMSMEYTRVGYHIQRWNRRLNSTKIAEVNESRENDKLLLKTITSVFCVMERCEGLFKMKETEMRVLLHYYTVMNSYATVEQAETALAGTMPRIVLLKSIRNLCFSGHLQKNYLTKRNEYTITGAGIKVVTDLMFAVFQNNNFAVC